MAYLVCHAEKQKTLTGMAHHIERIGVYDVKGQVVTEPDPANPNQQISKNPQIRYPENKKWNRGGGASFSDFTKAWKEEINNVERKPQKNASLTVSFNCSAGEEFWNDLRRNYPNDEDFYNKYEELFKDFRDMLDEMYPDAKTLKWATHYEETWPHMHVIKPCIIKSRKRLNTKTKPRLKCIEKASIEEREEYEKRLKEWNKEKYEKWKEKKEILKFSSGEFLGGIKGLEKLQDKAFEKIGKKWGLERGVKGSEARHTNQVEWQKELIKKDKEIEEKEENLNKQNADLNKKEIRVSSELHFVNNVNYAIQESKKNLNVGQRILIEVTTILNTEDVRDKERSKFYKLFFTELPNFIMGIIKRIRDENNQNKIKEKENTTTIKNVIDKNNKNTQEIKLS